jgi:hypothetical protein
VTTYKVSLPFEFKQRANELTAAVAGDDHDTLRQHLEKRDQDLENYLSKANSTVFYSTTTVDGGGTNVLSPAIGQPDWHFSSASGKFNQKGAWTGSNNQQNYGVATVVYSINFLASTTNGLARIHLAGDQDNRLIAFDTADTDLDVYTFTVSFGTYIGYADPTGKYPISVAPKDLGIAGLPGPNSAVFQRASYRFSVVD